VSNFHPYKRMDLLLEAYIASKALQSAYDLVLVGADQPERVGQALWRRAQSAGISDSVHMPGFVVGDELVGLYKAASVYVNLSEREAFPLTPAEALVNGTPIVLSGIDSFLEIYGEWATIANNQDPSSIAQCIELAIEGGARPDPVDVTRRLSWRRNGEAVASIILEASREGRPSLRASAERIDLHGLPQLLQTLIGTPRAPL
jgi:glycosyltransferase involved in cell wall biosynthesis